VHNWKICAIDGFTASGKTTLANQLAKDTPGTEVISMDDFFLPGQRRRASVYAKNYDLDRLQMQVLEPLVASKEVRYQPFDWANMVPSREYLRIPRDSKVVVDGTYSLDMRLRHYYDIAIWIETPESVRMTRKMDRGLSHQEAAVEEGIEELTYTTAIEPKAYAHLILRGAAPFPETAEIFSQLRSKLEPNSPYTQNHPRQGI
jgi:uridine kinase